MSQLEYSEHMKSLQIMKKESYWAVSHPHSSNSGTQVTDASLQGSKFTRLFHGSAHYLVPAKKWSKQVLFSVAVVTG